MNGIHDMGGMDGFGPVQSEPNEPPFHHAWEGRALAMNRALGFAKLWTIDTSRAKIEELPPQEYLGRSYYEKWAKRLELLLIERGYIGEDEVAAGRALRPGKPLPRVLPAAEVNKVLTRGSYSREPTGPARFKAGDRVRTRNIHPQTHTRLPRYARDKVGTIECVRGFHVFPDTVAIGQGEHPQWLYTVVFNARELWGDDADPALTVSIEAWDPYLEPA
jgi:nitrile hydratase